MELGKARLTEKRDIGLADINVLVRADAGSGLPPLAPAELAVPDDGSAPLCVIDFADRTHPVLRRLSASRREAYEDILWALINTKEFIVNH